MKFCPHILILALVLTLGCGLWGYPVDADPIPTNPVVTLEPTATGYLPLITAAVPASSS
jgi:hypothetical protein